MFKMIPALILSIALGLVSGPQSYGDEAPVGASPRFLVHLLDYLAKDYAGAVGPGGKILSQSEYNEQKEFCATALETAGKITEIQKDSGITDELKSLNALILSRGNPTEVSKSARDLQIKVIQRTQLEVAPVAWPSLKRGKQLFAQNCVTCHGERGGGDGPAGVSLDPKPANFLDDHMKEISPFQAFNTIRLGVPGTGMPSFHALSDKEAWDLAFYVVSLRYEQSAQASASLSVSPELLKQVATFSDEKLAMAGNDKKDQDKKNWIALLRTHSDDDEGSGRSLDFALSELDEALKEYQAGNTDSAKNKALRAYLEGIEPIEPRLRATDPAAVSDLEDKMAQVRSLIDSRKSVALLQAAVEAAKGKISEAQTLMQTKKMSPWIAFLAAAAILLREGFEAVLVIIALLGVIRASGKKRAAHWVHGGWMSALGLGAVAWFFSGWLMGMSGAQREALEGVTSLFAVAVLLTVGFWLHSQTEIGRWKAFIHGKVQKALDGKNLWGLASISFIAVFREAFETVLFLRAIWLEGGDGAKVAMLLGVLGSLAFVIAMAWAILRYSAKIPIRRLFEASAVIMAGLALILTGKGLHSLQETGLISVSTPPISAHFDLIGFYPTWETLLSQLFILGLVFSLWNWGKKPSAISMQTDTVEE